MKQVCEESCQDHYSASHFEKQSAHKYWVRKCDEVLREDFNKLWIITRLIVFDDCNKTTRFLESLFQLIIINPFLMIKLP